MQPINLQRFTENAPACQQNLKKSQPANSRSAARPDAWPAGLVRAPRAQDKRLRSIDQRAQEAFKVFCDLWRGQIQRLTGAQAARIDARIGGEEGLQPEAMLVGNSA